MTKKQMRQWQVESIKQALEELEPEVMVQYAGYVTFTGN